MKAAVLLTLLASVTAAVAVAPAARACRYCQQAADPVEVMRFQGQGRNAGSFPLDDSLNDLGGNRTPVPLPAVVTTAAELPARPIVTAAAPVVPTPAAAPLKTPPAPAVVAQTPVPAASVRWADLGLVALAGGGGWFAWRTRAARPVATA